METITQNLIQSAQWVKQNKFQTELKTSVEQYAWMPFAAWTLNRNGRLSRSKLYTFNQIRNTGHFACNTNIKAMQINVECNIENFNEIFPCRLCTNFDILIL